MIVLFYDLFDDVWYVSLTLIVLIDPVAVPKTSIQNKLSFSHIIHNVDCSILYVLFECVSVLYLYCRVLVSVLVLSCIDIFGCQK